MRHRSEAGGRETSAGRALCIVVHGPYPVGEPRVERLVGVAVEQGFEADIVALRRPGEPACSQDGGVRIVRLPLEHRRGGGLARTAYEYVGFATLATGVVSALTLRRRYAVVHVNNPPDFLVFAAAFPKLLGARVIFDVHDLSSDMFAMRFAKKRGAPLADRVLRIVEKLATRFADVVVTVHEPYRRELVTRGVPSQKVRVVMNTPDERSLPAGHASPAREGFRVVYHGTVTPDYGVELLVEAAAHLAPTTPDLRVEIYGEGDALPAARARAHDCGIADRVRFSERYLPHADVLERVHGADVGVIPNRPTRLNRFALSSKLFEYVALGIPVVAADLPTIRAHFDDREIAYFPAGDATALADTLLAVRRDPVAAAARAAAARRRYEKYRWSVSAREYATVLTG